MKYEALWSLVQSQPRVTMYLPTYPRDIMLPQVGYYVEKHATGRLVADIPTDRLELNFDFTIQQALDKYVQWGVWYVSIHNDDSYNIGVGNHFIDIKDAMKYSQQVNSVGVLELHTGKFITRKDKK